MKTNSNPYRENDLMSFRNAFRGIGHIIRSERNFRLQLGIGIMVIAFGFIFQISPLEWILLILAIGLVLVAEAINSAFERLCDRITGEYDEQIRTVKDISAGAVLIAAFVAIAIGAYVFCDF